mgnify:CR=1 FL=1
MRRVRSEWELEMWYILYVSSVHTGPARMQDRMAFGSSSSLLRTFLLRD